MKYKTILNKKGRIADDLVQTNILILFDNNTDDFLKDFGFTHERSQLLENIVKNDILVINDKEYPIIKVGNLVNKELKENGHTTIKIDPTLEDDSENVIYISGENLPLIDSGTVLEIK